MKRPLTFITRSALIAALYFAVTAAVSAISFGPLQFRLSEALVLLAAVMPEAIPGLTIGCVLSNLAFSPYSLYDMLFGGLATLLGAAGSYLLRKNIPLAALPPILLNALLVPVIWIIDGGSGIYLISVLEIFASEMITVGVIGIPFTYAVRRALTVAGVLKIDNGFVAPPYVRIEKSKNDGFDDKSPNDSPNDFTDTPPDGSPCNSPNDSLECTTDSTVDGATDSTINNTIDNLSDELPDGSQRNDSHTN